VAWSHFLCMLDAACPHCIFLPRLLLAGCFDKWNSLGCVHSCLGELRKLGTLLFFPSSLLRFARATAAAAATTQAATPLVLSTPSKAAIRLGHPNLLLAALMVPQDRLLARRVDHQAVFTCVFHVDSIRESTSSTCWCSSLRLLWLSGPLR